MRSVASDPLIENPDLYFTMLDDAQLIPLDLVISTKSAESQPDSVDRAEQLMRAAAAGQQRRRAPITVRAEDGSYVIVDGNATFAVARRQGWLTIPVRVQTS